MTYKNILIFILTLSLAACSSSAPSLIISEFQASNSYTLKDQDGDYSDWIEIQNQGSQSVNLANMSLTDDPKVLDKWKFPNKKLSSGDFLLVFASGKDQTNPSKALHTNFQLAQKGEFLALVNNEGEILDQFSPHYPGQFSNRSYGRSKNQIGYFGKTTPGKANKKITELNPQIINVNSNLTDSKQAIIVSAEIKSLKNTNSKLNLHYRFMYDQEKTIAMKAQDKKTYTASIPLKEAKAGQMLRWYISVENQKFNKSPTYYDPYNSPQYHGTVIGKNQNNKIPEIKLFSKYPITDNQKLRTKVKRYPNRASVFFNNKLYDNIGIRYRGVNALEFPRKSYKLRFNKGHNFYFDQELSSLREVNLQSPYGDPSYIRQVIASNFFKEVNVSAPTVKLVRLSHNNQSLGLSLLIEQVDNNFLNRNKISFGSLYKAYERGYLNNPSYLQPKLNSSYKDILEIITALKNKDIKKIETYLENNFDMEELINYLAANVIIYNYDNLFHNYYLHRDAEFSKWKIIPWDFDLTFGRFGYDSNTAHKISYELHPFYGSKKYQDIHNKHHLLIDAVVSSPKLKKTFLNRVKELNQKYLHSDYFPKQIKELSNLIEKEVTKDKKIWNKDTSIVKDYKFQNAIRTLLDYLKQRKKYLDSFLAEF